MRLLIIPDKFKGSLTSEEVYEGFKKGVEQIRDNTSFHFVKASDGGDGFLDAIMSYKDCIRIEMETQDPLGRFIQTYYIYDKKERSAYIEMANSSGMELLKPLERNAALTSTLGTGEHIRDAVQKGAEHIYVGLGGSATNDGGIGIANALGFEFFDDHGNLLKPIGKNLNKLDSIGKGKGFIDTSGVKFYAINDVKNPLFGPNGAAFVYAKQKGADENQIKSLDEGLINLAEVVKATLNKDAANISGSGAAGGTGYGLKVFLNAEFLSGVDFILEISGVKQVLNQESFDYIVTGEGKIDSQTLSGKLIQGVMDLAEIHEIPVLAVCGMLDVPLKELTSQGVMDVIEIRDPNRDLEYNMSNAKMLLETKVASYFKQQFTPS